MGRPKKVQVLQSPSDPNRAQSFLAKARDAVAAARAEAGKRKSETVEQESRMSVKAKSSAKSSASAPAKPPTPPKAPPKAAVQAAHAPPPKPSMPTVEKGDSAKAVAKGAPEVPPIRCTRKVSEAELALHRPKALSLAPPPAKAAKQPDSLSGSPGSTQASSSTSPSGASDRTRLFLEKAKALRLAAAKPKGSMPNDAKEVATKEVTTKVSEASQHTGTKDSEEVRSEVQGKETKQPKDSCEMPSAPNTQETKQPTDTKQSEGKRDDEQCKDSKPNSTSGGNDALLMEHLITPPSKVNSYRSLPSTVSLTPSPVQRMQALSSFTSDEDHWQWEPDTGCSQRSYYGSRGESWWGAGWDYYPPSQSWFWDHCKQRYVGAWGDRCWSWQPHEDKSWSNNGWDDRQTSWDHHGDGQDEPYYDVDNSEIHRALYDRQPSSVSDVLNSIVSPSRVGGVENEVKEPDVPGINEVKEPDAPIAPGIAQVKEPDAPIAPGTTEVKEPDAPIAPGIAEVKEPDVPIPAEVKEPPKHDGRDQSKKHEDGDGAVPIGEDAPGPGPDGWRLNKKGEPVSAAALWMRFYRSIRSP